jgi:hypothetical protein
MYINEKPACHGQHNGSEQARQSKRSPLTSYYTYMHPIIFADLSPNARANPSSDQTPRRIVDFSCYRSRRRDQLGATRENVRYLFSSNVNKLRCQYSGSSFMRFDNKYLEDTYELYGQKYTKRYTKVHSPPGSHCYPGQLL